MSVSLFNWCVSHAMAKVVHALLCELALSFLKVMLSLPAPVPPPTSQHPVIQGVCRLSFRHDHTFLPAHMWFQRPGAPGSVLVCESLPHLQPPRHTSVKQSARQVHHKPAPCTTERERMTRGVKGLLVLKKKVMPFPDFWQSKQSR